MYPSAHGVFTLGTKLDESVPTLGNHLRQLGYRSTLIGKAHFHPLASTPECESVETYPTLRDLNFWRTFNDRQIPWYGFDHVELTRNHTDEGHAGQHYRIWLENQGIHNWRTYFQIGNDGVNVTGTDASQAPALSDRPGFGWRKEMSWKLPEELHYTAWTSQRTIAAIKQSVADDQPFFIWSSYHDPHPPYCVPKPWASMYDQADMKIASYFESEMNDMPPPLQMTRGTD